MEFIKTNWGVLFAGFAVLFLIVLAPSFFIELYRNVFTIPKGITNGDLLSYFGVSLGLIGSTFVFLANKMKEQSDLKAIRIQERNDNRPFIVVECSGNKYGVYPKLKLTNVGVNPVTQIRIFEKDVAACLQPGESFEIVMTTNPADVSDSSRLLLDKKINLEGTILGCPAHTTIEATGVKYGKWSASLTANQSGMMVYYSEKPKHEPK